MDYIATTFSPAMLAPGHMAAVAETDLGQPAPVRFLTGEPVSAVGHEVTARILSALLGREVPFNRVNLRLEEGDRVLCVIPQFRASEAREFTKKEVEDAGFRAFVIYINKLA